jgi:hypothetical protein
MKTKRFLLMTGLAMTLCGCEKTLIVERTTVTEVKEVMPDGTTHTRPATDLERYMVTLLPELRATWPELEYNPETKLYRGVNTGKFFHSLMFGEAQTPEAAAEKINAQHRYHLEQLQWRKVQ